ncbi:hypothetical protein C8R45DRAFT_1030271 [Mycena sanguinolenta]|nr:hypothetical protein C8R45DRAFT_1030271 [Mycena sanguinolenta]
MVRHRRASIPRRRARFLPNPAPLPYGLTNVAAPSCEGSVGFRIHALDGHIHFHPLSTMIRASLLVVIMCFSLAVPLHLSRRRRAPRLSYLPQHLLLCVKPSCPLHLGHHHHRAPSSVYHYSRTASGWDIGPCGKSNLIIVYL